MFNASAFAFRACESGRLTKRPHFKRTYFALCCRCSDEPDSIQEIKSLPDQYRCARAGMRLSLRSAAAWMRLCWVDDRFLGSRICMHLYLRRLGVNKIEGFLAPLVEKGLKAVLLFGVIGSEKKVGCLLLHGNLKSTYVESRGTQSGLAHDARLQWGADTAQGGPVAAEGSR